MQKLSEIYEQLTMGELSQVSLGGGELGAITEANSRHVANHIKLGLTALYKRFELKRGRLIVQLFPDQEDYLLTQRYATNGKNTMEPRRWILDTVDKPFGDDILKILGVTGDTGNAFVLNDYSDEYSIMTPTMESLRVPRSIVNSLPFVTPDEYRTSKLTLDYQANHPNFMPRVGYFDPELVNIELPASHTQALLYFVASRVNNPIGMGQEFNAGNNWAQRFEQECVRLEMDGNEINDQSGNTRARRGGWV